MSVSDSQLHHPSDRRKTDLSEAALLYTIQDEIVLIYHSFLTVKGDGNVFYHWKGSLSLRDVTSERTPENVAIHFYWFNENDRCFKIRC